MIRPVANLLSQVAFHFKGCFLVVLTYHFEDKNLMKYCLLFIVIK